MRGRPKRTIVASSDVAGINDASNPNVAACPRRATPTIWLKHLLPLRVTEVFNTYWKFAAERQATFLRRLNGLDAPWSNDPIISTYKFTNAFRASDRVSQYLIRNVIYRDDLPNEDDEVFFRILLFKLFNKIETWELLERTLGGVSWASYSFDLYDRALSKALHTGNRIYSAAYIMPPGSSAFGMKLKHQNHLRLLELMMKQSLPKRLRAAKSMQVAFELIRAYPTIGDFLAYQFATDVNYSEITNFSEMDFVVPGPGARDGIKKCFVDLGGLSEPEIIRFMVDNQEKEFERLGLHFDNLWGRRLQLIDCQNLFCEVDKYSRVAHPDITGVTGRSRIKQKFQPKNSALSLFYPPKWGINDTIKKEYSNTVPSFRLDGR